MLLCEISVLLLTQATLSDSEESSSHHSSEASEQGEGGIECDDYGNAAADSGAQFLDAPNGPIMGSTVIDAKNKFCTCVICKAKSNQAIGVL